MCGMSVSFQSESVKLLIFISFMIWRKCHFQYCERRAKNCKCHFYERKHFISKLLDPLTHQLEASQWNSPFYHIRAKCNLSIEINLHLGGIRGYYIEA